MEFRRVLFRLTNRTALPYRAVEQYKKKGAFLFCFVMIICKTSKKLKYGFDVVRVHFNSLFRASRHLTQNVKTSKNDLMILSEKIGAFALHDYCPFLVKLQKAQNLRPVRLFVGSMGRLCDACHKAMFGRFTQGGELG